MQTNRRQMSGCEPCNHVVSYELVECPKCGGKMETLSAWHKPPKQTASKYRWKLFWKSARFW